MTKRVDIGAIKLSEGYFLGRPKWRETGKTEVLTGDSLDAETAFLHVHPELPSSNLKAGLLELIKQAKNKVFVVSFIISDEDIVDALIEKAGELKGRVYVVSCLDDRILQQGLAEEDVTDSTASRQMKCRQRLTEGGVWFRGYGDCHAKYAMADDRVAIVCTSNFEKYPLTDGGEIGIRLTLPREVERIGRHFTRLWHERCNWELAPGEQHTVANRQIEPSPCKVIPPPEDSSPGAIWTDGSEHYILRHLHRVIDSAQKELLLATFSARDIAQYPELLIHPLERALLRGVIIRMLTRRPNHNKGNRESMKVLTNLGVKIFGDKRNHAKGAIADGQTGVMFSANFDAQHGLTSGIEMGVVLDKTKALADFHRYLNFAMKKASDIFVPQPTHQEMNARLRQYTSISWPLEMDLSVVADPICWNQFSAAAGQGPVLFSTDETGLGIFIFAGYEVFSVKLKGVIYELTACPGMREIGGSVEMLAMLWKKKGATERALGFCPATFTIAHPVQNKKVKLNS